MIVGGLDLSLTATGYALIENTKLIASGVITPPNGMRGEQRLAWVIDEIEGMLDLKAQFNIRLMALEGYSFGSRNKLADLGELGGVVKVGLLDLGIPRVIVSPNQLKKFITGKGSGKKNVVLMHTFKMFGMEFNDDNECDAFVLAKIAEALVGANDYKLSKPQQQVIDKVKGGDFK